jgi:hypothetical protein
MRATCDFRGSPDGVSPSHTDLPDTQHTHRNSKKENSSDVIDEFKIKIVRIEMISPNERGEDVRLEFQFESDQINFSLPVFVNSREFDDTEVVEVARSRLYEVFKQLLSQCEGWQLSSDERRQLARISARPAP